LPLPEHRGLRATHRRGDAGCSAEPREAFEEASTGVSVGLNNESSPYLARASLHFSSPG